MMVLPSFLYAQRFGDTEEQIKAEMSKQTSYKFLDKRDVKGNLIQLTYISEDTSKSFFIDQSKKCIMITILYPLKDLPDVIKINNQMDNTVKTGDLEWFNHKSNIKIFMKIFKEDQVFQETLIEN